MQPKIAYSWPNSILLLLFYGSILKMKRKYQITVIFKNLHFFQKCHFCFWKIYIVEYLNISGYIWSIFKDLDFFKIYTEPGFWNTHQFNSQGLLELKNDHTKSVSLYLGHPVPYLFSFIYTVMSNWRWREILDNLNNQYSNKHLTSHNEEGVIEAVGA